MTRLALFLRQIGAFLARDTHTMLSYRLDFCFNLFWVLVTVATTYFVSGIFIVRPDARFAQWHDPLAAWITGMAFMNYFMSGFSTLSNAIRGEQGQGTLESVLMTPITMPAFIVSSSVFSLLNATFFSALHLAIGRWVFGLRFQGSFGLALLFLVVTTAVLASLGILSASFAMVFKRGDPIAVVLGTGSAMLSGVLFPTELLGGFLGRISHALPTTYGLDGVRRVLIQGQTLSQARQPMIVLSVFLLVLLPFSLWVFNCAVRQAKREGSLIQY